MGLRFLAAGLVLAACASRDDRAARRTTAEFDASTFRRRLDDATDPPTYLTPEPTPLTDEPSAIAKHGA